MAQPPAFFREAGAGPGVVCLHSNASNSSQWRGLLDLLSPKYRVLAPDSYGAGKSADWASDRVIALKDEVDFIAPVLAAAGDPCCLVGHSYGAAVALIAALAQPGRVRALALYEPTLFSLVDAASPSPNAADGIRQTVHAAGRALDARNPDDAARHFIDYWMGSSSWDHTPDARKPPIAGKTPRHRRKQWRGSWRGHCRASRWWSSTAWGTWAPSPTRSPSMTPLRVFSPARPTRRRRTP